MVEQSVGGIRASCGIDLSFVVAALNEESAIERCLESLLGQNIDPRTCLEVLVIDGGSTDSTTEIVRRIASADHRVRLLQNPKRSTPIAFNIGWRASRGRYVSLASAHSVTQFDYAARLIETFQDTSARLVGGRCVSSVPAAAGRVPASIAIAMASPAGVGNAKFRYATTPGWVDTAFPGAYEKTLLEELGGFDEELSRNQDDDLHLRAALAGHRMWLEPTLVTEYQPRTGFRALYAQYRDYGYYRWLTIAKHRHIVSLRHLAPPILLGLLTLSLAGASALRTWWPLLTPVLYLLAVMGLLVRRVRSLSELVLVTAACVCLHVAYGLGFWSAVLASSGRISRVLLKRNQPMRP